MYVYFERGRDNLAIADLFFIPYQSLAGVAAISRGWFDLFWLKEGMDGIPSFESQWVDAQTTIIIVIDIIIIMALFFATIYYSTFNNRRKAASSHSII